MKNLAKSVALASTVLLLAGCTSYHASQPTSTFVGKVESSIKADVSVGQSIQGQASGKILFGLFSWGTGENFIDGVDFAEGSSVLFNGPLAKVKAAATYNAVKASGADLIVAPRYEVTEMNYGVYKEVRVMVHGYKGTIVSIK